MDYQPFVLSFMCTIYMCIVYSKNQGWGAGAGRSRVFLAPWSRNRNRFEKKSGAGAATKY